MSIRHVRVNTTILEFHLHKIASLQKPFEDFVYSDAFSGEI